MLATTIPLTTCAALILAEIVRLVDMNLIFLPGLGADSRLFKFQTAAFPGSVAVDWIDPLPGETLKNYAVRFADSLGPFTPPPIVCGLSLGGMIAPYVAKRLGASKCLLLCTVRNPKEFPRRYYPAWLLGRFCPPLSWIVQFLLRLFARFLLLFQAFWRHRIDPEVVRQFAQTPTTRLVRLTRMMLDWAYLSKGLIAPELETLQVHGTRDPLLPIRSTTPDIRIERGGHLLVLTHPAEINAILRDLLQKSEPHSP